MNLNRFPTPVLWFALGLLVGAYLGQIIRGFITIAFFVGLIVLAYYIWRFFEGHKRA
ncbi:hypothetical protein Mterra_03701 [Calidithermus terrae]|uniref:Uncharacterized protein n=1 Tax=Calidithermus terrae TaxID=1408545 RepID=A0A399E3F8_9DEIN|nr:hypothetical protein [Calidithermus terrae]RIH78083.1 hypothetical protein Mterra_03701 [Calidithermus terrae]